MNAQRLTLHEHVLEIVSDSGEGAQKAARAFADASARMGNALWTVEIIPSEIQPPPHTTGAASGNRIRLADHPVGNGGDRAQLVLAFNEMALLSRLEAGAVADDATVIIDSQWADSDDPRIRRSYRDILAGMRRRGATVHELPIEAQARDAGAGARHGKNMWALGLLAFLYARDEELIDAAVRRLFAGKDAALVELNLRLVDAGRRFAAERFATQYDIPAAEVAGPQVAMNGNTALALGAAAAGFRLCAVYPITPATSIAHFLAEHFDALGGCVHQAEDEIAAVGVALGASYAGVPAFTVTSGPGMALMTEFQGLAAMTETPLVIVDVQRGGPSTGLPTKIEQSDLLHAIHGTPGDAPKIVLAPGSIEECFHVMATARTLAERFRMPVIVLSDANLATGQQSFARPRIDAQALAQPARQLPVTPDMKPFDWDEQTGLSPRLLPGQPGGTYVTTGLNHGRDGHVRYDARSNQDAHRMRSRKLAALQRALRPPAVHGAEAGELLLVGWGSTQGLITEVVDRLVARGYAASSLHIKVLNPLPRGLQALLRRFSRVMTVELNYSDDWGDPLIDADSRRYGQLAQLLRAHTLVDVDCFTRVPGRPLMPEELERALLERLPGLDRAAAGAAGDAS